MNHLKSILWAGTNYSSCVIFSFAVSSMCGENSTNTGDGLWLAPPRVVADTTALDCLLSPHASSSSSSSSIVIACHAKIQHNDSCDHQTQWTGMFTEIGFGAQRNSRYCSESHICLAITRTSQHSISILPHVIALFCVCQELCAQTLQTNMKTNPCVFIADKIHQLQLFPS